MKKRILSVLLVCCLLASLLPVTATAATETQVEEQAAYASSYLDLYVKEGLLLLFDAGAASADTVDLAGGVWYGQTLQGGVLTVDKSYAATLGGGAYDAESNPNGWQYEAGMLAWREPSSMTATGNYMHFSESWLPDTFAVDILFAPYLRNACTDKEEAAGITLLSEDTAAGTKTYMLTRSTPWNNASLAHAAWTISLSGGSGTYAVPNGGWGSGVVTDASHAPTADGYYVKNSDGTYTQKTWTSTPWGSVTFGTDGKATLSVGTRGSAAIITLPSTVTIDGVSAWVVGSEHGYDQAMVIGNLYGYAWTSLSASNTWGNGFGNTRWTVANGSWGGGPVNQTGNGVLTTDTSICDSNSFVTFNGTPALFSVVNDGTRYTVTHGGVSVLDKALNGREVTSRNFKILHRLPGAVYGMRVYESALTEAQALQNAFADLAARYDLDVTEMALNRLSDYAYIYRYFVDTYALEGEDAATMQKNLDTLLGGEATMTAYDRLYVQDGLVGLYTAFASDRSLNREAGIWLSKKDGKLATIAGQSLLSRDSKGGLTTGAWDNAAWLAGRDKIGISLPEAYAALADFTVDISARFFTVSDGAATSYHSARSSMRFDIWGVTAFVNESGANNHHFRGMLSNYPWGVHNGAWVDGMHTGLNKDGTASATYVAISAQYTNNTPVWLSVIKDTVTDGVTFRATFGGAAYGGRTLSTDVYNTIASRTSDTTIGRFSLLNGNPGTIYAIRVYDRPLSATELTQNKAVDLLAYFGVDVSALSAKNAASYSGLFQEIAAYTYDNASAATLQALVDEYAALYTPAKMSDYDKLYVSDGLVALYTAYGTSDSSLILENGKVTAWKNKLTGAPATVTGAFVPNYDGDGGFGIAPQTMAEWQAGHAFGVRFADSFADLEDFTVENIVRYRAHTTNHASSGDAQFDSTAISIRYDIIAGLVWNTSAVISPAYRFHIRTMLTNVGWGAMSCNGTTALRLDGGTGYCGNGYDLTENKPVNHTFIKNNDGSSVFFRIALDGVTTYNAGGFSNEGSITVAQYNTLRATSGATTGCFSTLNGTSGSLYAVRIYNRTLTEAERAQNNAVDLFAYHGIDLTNYPTDPIKQAWIASALQGNTISSTEADLVQRVVDSDLVTVSFYTAAGTPVDKYAVLRGSTLTLPTTLEGETVAAWNGTIAPGTITSVTEDVVYTATAACSSHKFGTATVTQAPTHTIAGESRRTCSICGTIRIETIPVLAGHEYGIWEAVDGIRHEHTCSCGKVEHAPHGYDNGRVITPPSYTAAGVLRRTCTDCGYTVDEDIPKLTTDSFALSLSSPEVKRGEQVAVTISATSNPGFAYLLMSVQYDESILTLVNAESTTSALTIGRVGNTISLDAARNHSESGVLCTLTFAVSEETEAKEVAISLTASQCFDEDTATLTPTAIGGKVTISTILYGDANGDGAVDGKDVIVLRKYLVGSGDITEGADANGDGTVDGKDVIVLRKYLVGTATLGPES